MQSSILASLSDAAENDLEDGEADLLLPFNPGLELAHLDNPDLVLVGGGPWRILGNLHARFCTGLVRGVLSTTSVIAPHCSAQEHAA